MDAAQEKKRFFELADRLARTRDPEEQSRLKEELRNEGPREST
jgi:hypothetical protein